MKMLIESLEVPDAGGGLSENLGGYSLCFYYKKIDKLDDTADIVASAVYDHIMELVQDEGMYAIGWMIRKYTGSSNVH